jgi:hypothetical protein
MGGACSMYYRWEFDTRCWSEKVNRKDHLEDLDALGMILIYAYIYIRKLCKDVDFNELLQEWPVAGFCGHIKEPSGFKNDGKSWMAELLLVSP